MSNRFIYCPYCKAMLDIYNELHFEDIGFVQIIYGTCTFCHKKIAIASENIYRDAPKG